MDLDKKAFLKKERTVQGLHLRRLKGHRFNKISKHPRSITFKKMMTHIHHAYNRAHSLHV